MRFVTRYPVSDWHSCLPCGRFGMESVPESIKKVVKFARETGDLQTLSDVDLKLIALTYMLESQIHGTHHLRECPPPLHVVNVKSLKETEMPGWGSNVTNMAEWEALDQTSTVDDGSIEATVVDDAIVETNVLDEAALRLTTPSGTRGMQIHNCTVFTSLPQGGRDAITKNPILREDQLPHKLLYPKTKKKSNNKEDDFFSPDDIFYTCW
ncbi:hypothetical protein J5N97_016216 [Dioscorea zingiberensis]|uniref:Ribonuclease PIN domain-containing protein n=1 Tax=Dioscorea zingiberensis TaxID=325984 RepID=A0A9D5HEZ7_9LILI|nr:hypothetical protein J5N97_016216 [Dioscorea zingiberensis]